MQDKPNVTQIIEQAQDPTVKIVWLYASTGLETARVDLVNGSRQKFPVTETELVELAARFRADGWQVTPSVSGFGWTARKPVNVCPHCKGHGVVNGTTEWGTVALQKCPVCAPIPFMGEPGEAADDDSNSLALHVDF